MIWIPIDKLTLSLSCAITHGTYDKGSIATTGFNIANTPTCTANPTPNCRVPVTTDISGLDMFGSSKSTAQASARYDLPRPSTIGDLSAEIDYAYHSQQTLVVSFDPIGAPLAPRLPAFGLANFRMDLAKVAGTGLDIDGWVKNLTNKTYITNQQLFADSLGVDEQQCGNPRTFGVDFTYRFGAMK